MDRLRTKKGPGVDLPQVLYQRFVGWIFWFQVAFGNHIQLQVGKVGLPGDPLVKLYCI